MRKKFFMFTIAVVAMLTSCNRHESLLTGGYGERVVAGQVVMASEMADSSPAGVEVSVVGTGMSAILAADGRFTFAGVPADAELAFRRADGVDARIRVSSPAPLLVELAGKTATSNGSHRRGVSTKDPGPSQQIEGVIHAVAPDFHSRKPSSTWLARLRSWSCPRTTPGRLYRLFAVRTNRC